MDISLIIKEIRKSLKLSQAKFADITGIQRGSLAQIETDRQQLSLEQLNCIVNLFNINASVFFELANLDPADEKKLLPDLLPKLLPKSDFNEKKLYSELSSELSSEVDFDEISDLNDKKKCTPECTPKCTPESDFDEDSDFSDKKNGYLNGYLNQISEKKSNPNGEKIEVKKLPILGSWPGASATLAEQGGIPLLTTEAAAGLMTGDGVQVLEYECEHYLVPAFRGAEFLIRVTGNSMTPKFDSGDIVACAKLPLDSFFQWNKVYVLDTVQGVIIKRVKRSEKADHILIVSENTDFDPFDLHLSEVRGLASVIGLIRLE